ncbi:amidase [Nocardia mangyaensis]|uniref:amidase n=1 Tax=Nocardia mangyaensis TaxID=2213200 RepID=A0A1J0VNK9_9NOCA|nr:amidase [Nocardia mangyaensis]APE33575.1 amidase [Nocardia mangyaensis]
MTPKTGAGLSIRELASALADGRLTACAVTAAALDRIEASQSTLNAFRVIRREQALADAAAAERRIAAGERAPLLGVPVAIKDDTDITGEATSFGCSGTFVPKQADAEAVRRLRAAGAVIVGKTNTPELGQWPFTSGAAFGYTRNPWDARRSPGGSSGGNAAAVAAELVPAALGSDGGGSLRIPAGWTNLVAIKPQRGRIPTLPDPEPFHGLTVLGPLARTVGDAALLLDVAARTTVSAAVGADPGTLRVALSMKPPFTACRIPLDPEVEETVASVAGVLRGLGHIVVPGEPNYPLALSFSMVSRVVAGIRQRLAALPDVQVDARTRAKAARGVLVSGPVLRRARAIEPRLHRHVGRIFDDVELILAPTTACAPPTIDVVDGLGNLATDRVVLGTIQYTFPWNVLGWPSVNIPAGFTTEGLPIGAQLMGPPDSEPLLVSVAAQIESVVRWDLQRPAPWWGR